MSTNRNVRHFKRPENYSTEGAKNVAIGESDCGRLVRDRALDLLADAQRQLNTVQERINEARELLKTS